MSTLHARPDITATAVNHRAHMVFQSQLIHSTPARYALAGLRILLGWTFMWPFIDKLFGLGYATPSARAWIHGGTPAQGFMKHATGPFGGFFSGLADTMGPAADWLFMLGLFGIGIALLTGCGLKLAAISGTVLLGCMYLAELPFADHGAGVHFMNPLTDDHWLEAFGLVVCAVTLAGDTLGLGRWWARIVGNGILR